MDHATHTATQTPDSERRRPRAWGAALLMLGVIAAFYLLREHWNHVAGSWLYLLLLLCPLMHLFHGHGGHGGHEHHDSHSPRSAPK